MKHASLRGAPAPRSSRTRVLALLIPAGVALAIGGLSVIWAMVSSRAAPYLFGALVLAACAAVAVLGWTRGTSPRIQRDGSRSRRSLIRALPVWAGVITLAVLLAVPHSLKAVQTHSGLRWSVKQVAGPVVRIHDQQYVVSVSRDSDDTTLQVLDPETGTTRWSLRGGWNRVTAEGQVVHIDPATGSGESATVAVYSRSGKLSWSTAVPESFGEVVMAAGARDGAIAIRACTDSPKSKSAWDCTFTGFDSAGTKVWTKQASNMIGGRPGDSSLAWVNGQLRSNTPLPAGLVYFNDATSMHLLDIATGAELATLPVMGPGERRRNFAVFGDTLLTTAEREGSCTVQGLDLATGKRRWRSSFRCPGLSSSPYIISSIEPADVSVASAALLIRNDGNSSSAWLVNLSNGDIRTESFSAPGDGRPHTVKRFDRLRRAVRGDYLFHPRDRAFTVTGALTGERLWSATVPGKKLVSLAAGPKTVVAVSQAPRSHNPALAEHFFGTTRYRDIVTIYDGATGARLSSTLIPEQVRDVSVVAAGRAFVRWGSTGSPPHASLVTSG